VYHFIKIQHRIIAKLAASISIEAAKNIKQIIDI